jgi:hypothetical protein
MPCRLQIAAFLPAKGKFVPDEEEELARPKGALQDPSISLANPKKVLHLRRCSCHPPLACSPGRGPADAVMANPARDANVA